MYFIVKIHVFCLFTSTKCVGEALDYSRKSEFGVGFVGFFHFVVIEVTDFHVLFFFYLDFSSNEWFQKSVHMS